MIFDGAKSKDLRLFLPLLFHNRVLVTRLVELTAGIRVAHHNIHLGSKACKVFF